MTTEMDNPETLGEVTADEDERQRLLNLVGVSEEEFDEADLPKTLDDCTPDERAIIYAMRRGDTDGLARLMVQKMLKDGFTAADILEGAIATGDPETVRAYTKAVNAQINPVPEQWTYERRLALHILGVMGLGYPGLHEEMFSNGDSPSSLHSAIDEIADALISGMHTLGSPDHLSLAKILDYASSFDDPAESDGAE